MSFWAWDKGGTAHWFVTPRGRPGQRTLTAEERARIRIVPASCGFVGPRAVVTRHEAGEIKRDHADICDDCLPAYEAETNTLIRHARSPRPAYRIARPQTQERGI